MELFRAEALKLRIPIVHVTGIELVRDEGGSWTLQFERVTSRFSVGVPLHLERGALTQAVGPAPLDGQVVQFVEDSLGAAGYLLMRRHSEGAGVAAAWEVIASPEPGAIRL